VIPFSEAAMALCVVLILLVPFAAAGLALINTGLGRSRSAAHSMLASLCVMSIAALLYILVRMLFLRGLKLDGSPASLALLLQMFTV